MQQQIVENPPSKEELTTDATTGNDLTVEVEDCIADERQDKANA